MFISKKKYYLFIENTRDLNLNLIKIRNKFIIIYRNHNKLEKISEIKNFRKKCKEKGIKFFIANDELLAVKINSDGLYISAFNKRLRHINLIKNGYKLIGSAHNIKEINQKKLQGCSTIILSRLFKTNYKYKKGFLGTIKFNEIVKRFSIEIVPLGGISINNLNKLKFVMCTSIACLSAIKKKPANIINRLF